MATHKVTPEQRRTVDSILKLMDEFLGIRRQMTTRANPKFAEPWTDLQYLLISQLRKTLEGQKMWGPIRYVVADVLTGDDKGMRRDLYTPTNQRCILAEIVEKEEDNMKSTGDVMKIHDFKTMYQAIDPGISRIATVMETYIWWDLPDACDVVRFQMRLARFKQARDKYTDELQKVYHQAIKKGDPNEIAPNQEYSLAWETMNLIDLVDGFSERRENEQMYKSLLATRPRKTDFAEEDKYIHKLANDLKALAKIEGGMAGDLETRERVAEGLSKKVEDLKDDEIKSYLESVVNDNRARLHHAADKAEGSGEPYNFKKKQLDHMIRAYKEGVGEGQHMKGLQLKKEIASETQSQSRAEVDKPSS